MCGVLAILLADGESHCIGDLVDGMTTLQHRGQDTAGITTAWAFRRPRAPPPPRAPPRPDNPPPGPPNRIGPARRCTKAGWENVKFHCSKDLGMVRDVFSSVATVEKLLGNVGIAHVRYPTAGGASCDEVQPFYANYPCGLSLAHNGNLVNAEQLRKNLVAHHRHLNTESDSEVLLNVFAEHLSQALEERRRGSPSVPGVARGSPIEPETLFAAVTQTMRRCRGGFAVVMLVHNVGVLAFRDPWGIRPLVLGRKPSKTVAGGVDYAISSESVALDTLGYELCRDVSPGEAILALPDRSAFREAPREGLVSLMCHENPRLYPCIFEYVYFARPDSTMNGVSVYSAQLKMGEKLAAKIKRTIGGRPPVDVVIAVPDTSRPIALQCAYSLGVVYREGFIKNRYIGRTFIMPGQAERRKGVRMKLNTIKSEFKGKSVLLIDDSIVRGTTSMELVAMAREAGATNVYFVSASPEVRYPNVYGINISKHKELIAHERTPDEIAAILRADWVLFQDLGDLEDCVRELNPQLAEFENSVFSGDYVTDADEPPDSRPGSPSKKKTPSPVITPEDVKLAALRI